MGNFIHQIMSIPTLLLFQIFWIAILLWFTWKVIKFSLMESSWYSTGFASIASFVLLIYTEGPQSDWERILLSLLPVLILAAGIGIRALFNCFAGMEDGGSVNSAERQRTLEMVEQGKITAEEGAELLEALGRSNAMLGQDKFSLLDMIILIGIAITVLGFFLPWSYVSKGMYQSGQHFGAEGWAVLIIALLAAVPVFVTPKDMLYKVSMLQVFLLLLDNALVVSLIIRISSRRGMGLPLCLVGIILAFVACFGKFKKLAF